MLKHQENALQLQSGQHSDRRGEVEKTSTETGKRQRKREGERERERETEREERQQIDKWTRVVLEEDREIENANSEVE